MRARLQSGVEKSQTQLSTHTHTELENRWHTQQQSGISGPKPLCGVEVGLAPVIITLSCFADSRLYSICSLSKLVLD